MSSGSSTTSGFPSKKMREDIRRVAILFAGGPAPAANAVISTAAVSFLRNSIQVLGIMHGYSNLQDFSSERPLHQGKDFMVIELKTLRRLRSSQGILVGTSRANPGLHISSPAHLDDEKRTGPLRRVYEALCSLGVDAVVSIGGDDTLKTANKFKMFQDRLPPGSKRIPIVHVPKTIDNDYMGIDFTFGFFTAIDTLANEIRNLLHDAEANRSYFLAETMGRSAGWLAYGAAIAGEASMVISVEDICGENETTEEVKDPITGQTSTRRVMNVDRVVGSIVKMMLARESEGKEYGVLVLAEGMAELLPMSCLEGVPRDDHGHLSISHINLSRRFAKLVADRYKAETGRSRRLTGIQLGYESRCARPNSFDVMLGSQLGVGAYRALVEKGLDGVMVSVVGQLELNYVAFEHLVHPETLVTNVRYIERGSDFHRLARFLETHINQ